MHYYYLIINYYNLEKKLHHIDDDLLVKYLLQEASVTEQQAVLQWMDATPDNQRYFTELKKVWDKSRLLATVVNADEHIAWEKFQQRIADKPSQKRRQLVTLKYLGRVAAVVMVVFGAAITGYLFFNKPAKEMVAQATTIPLTDTLPDGTVITVNNGSAVYYPSQFKKPTRQVTLKGEAFFNVAPDKKKPFVITVDDIAVTVVGTSFNIKQSGSGTEIVVETGIVQVNRGNATVTLKATERLLITDSSTQLVPEPVKDKLYNYYRTKEFVCDDTPLWKLVEKVNEAYGVTIIIERPELKELLLTTTFSNESLEQVLEVISLTFSIKVIREGDRILLQ